MEVADLEHLSVHELYWQVGTLTSEGANWTWTEQFPVNFEDLRRSAPRIRFIPVLRLEPRPGWSFTAENSTKLTAILTQIVRSTHADELQIDYEAPDRVIPSYIAFLRGLKDRKWHLSISGLGHWSIFAQQFAGAVDEITPMFYDLSSSEEVLHDGMLPDIAAAAVISSEMKKWQSCSVPWKAGLPNFSRVTVLDGKGVSRGNLRSWSWDDLWFSPLLAPHGPTLRGQTVFDVVKKGIMADTPIKSLDKIVVRYPELKALRSLMQAAKNDGAEGAIFFRLADGTDMSGYEADDLLGNPSTSPVTVSQENGQSAVLKTTRSLLPVVSQGMCRGYALALETSGEGWREAQPGDFRMVTTDSEGKIPAPDDLGLGTETLYFWFSHLRAGDNLKTGLLQHDSNDPVRWRIENLDSKNTWHHLDSR